MPDLSSAYFVNDLPGSTIPSSRLRNILEKIQKDLPLSKLNLAYLRQLGLGALERFIQEDLSYEEFKKLAQEEQSHRHREAENLRNSKIAAQITIQAEQDARSAANLAEIKANRLARESDPKYIRMMRNRALREKYGIETFIEEGHFARLMSILSRFSEGDRLSDDDSLWLATAGKDYYSRALRTAFHNRESEFFIDEYHRTNDPWNIVNASAHLRKCGKSEKADNLISSIPSAHLKAPKLRSAIATTHGGVMRDLSKLDLALDLGNQAHALTPKDFRPCTLLGAVNFELGDLNAGKIWYEKAIQRGATENLVDYEIRGILLRATDENCKKIVAFLLQQDPSRYRWVKSLLKSKKAPKQ